MGRSLVSHSPADVSLPGGARAPEVGSRTGDKLASQGTVQQDRLARLQADDADADADAFVDPAGGAQRPTVGLSLDMLPRGGERTPWSMEMDGRDPGGVQLPGELSFGDLFDRAAADDLDGLFAAFGMDDWIL